MPPRRRSAGGLRTPSRLSIEEVPVLRIKIDFTLELDGVEHAGVIRLVDAVAIERHFNVSLTENDPRNWSFDHMLYGAHHALKRAGVEVADYDAFLARLDGFDMPDDEEAAPDPKESEGSPEASSPSLAPPDPVLLDYSTSGALTSSTS